MPGRIRTIKPELLEDEKSAGLDHLTWRLFVSLLLLADDYGNLRGNVVQLRGAALWAASATDDDVAASLATLTQIGMVRPYEVRGQRYLHISGWARHQKVKNPGRPLMPGPESVDISPASAPGEDSSESLRRDGEVSSVEPTETVRADQRPTTNDQRPTTGQLFGSESEEGSDRQTRSRKQPEHPLPPAWSPSPEHREKAIGYGLDCALQAEKFRNHALQNDRRCARWNHAFTNWLISAHERQKDRPRPPADNPRPRRAL